MPNNDKYVKIMIESLEKKVEILDKIIIKTSAQSELITGKSYDDINWQQFDVLNEEKGTFIERIEELNDGFESLYKNMKNEINGNKEAYAEEIKIMQGLISIITDKSVVIETTEQRNKIEIDRIFSYTKTKIRDTKKSMKVASDYYKTMYGSHLQQDPKYLDSKK